ncbi:MAG: recombination protein O N-terminal domain-containing protein [Alistipes indistinctus]
MAGSYKARGIVLHTVKYGESSLVAYLFTDVGGRQTYMIQGSVRHAGAATRPRCSSRCSCSSSKGSNSRTRRCTA